MPILPIQTLTDDARLAPYANMRDAELAQRAAPTEPDTHPGLRGLFVAEGELVVRRLIASPFAVASVLLADNRVEALRDDLARLSPEVPLFVAPQHVFNQIIGFNMHRGVLAMGVRAAPLSWTQAVSRSGPLVVLEDLVNHDNLGAIFRNVAGLGGPAAAVVLSPRCADPLYRKSLRVSMGHVLTVPFVRAERWPDGLGELAAAGWSVLAMTPGPDAADLEQVVHQVAPRCAIVLGSEGPGLSASAMARATHCVRISMPPPPVWLANRETADSAIDSLNVGMAAGLALYRLGPASRASPGASQQ